jgi:GT2 family glycosyltransferase
MPKKTLDISVIIPFKDKASMTLQAVHSLLKYGPSVTEILLISNNSSAKELEIIHSGIDHIDNARVLEYNHPFNYQKINNWAVSKCSGKYILFLNNDTELTTKSVGLIEKMTEMAGKPNVGITGCLLLYGDGTTIQHAGVFLLPRGMADHLYVGKKLRTALRQSGTSEFPYAVTQDRPMTAVTGAVNVLEKEKFLKMGGFDERFIIGGGDVDLCIRLNKSGYQTWYVAGGHIIHKESQSRAHKPITYNDFYYSYLSYIKGYDTSVGDPYLPLITQEMK